MVTFNTDSLDFKDDEEVQYGTNSDFATRFDSVNNQLEIEDLTNASIGHIPRNVETDLVGGKLSETVSEGKALADDGNVYDSIQGAVDSASSWVKVGPGMFREKVSVSKDGLTLVGSGKRTIVGSSSVTNAISISASNVTIANLSTKFSTGDSISISSTSPNAKIINCTVKDAGRHAIILRGEDTLIKNCTIEESDRFGIIASSASTASRAVIVGNSVNNVGDDTTAINTQGDDSIIVYNSINDTTGDGVSCRNDTIVYGNRIQNSSQVGIVVSGNDSIIAKNRISNSGSLDIDDNGTGTVLDGNLTT